MAFNVGDCVQLRSGGPLMVVDEVSSCHVSVLWMDDMGDLQYAEVPIACIKSPEIVSIEPKFNPPTTH